MNERAFFPVNAVDCDNFSTAIAPRMNDGARRQLPNLNDLRLPPAPPIPGKKVF
ncbi:hypothetical protein MiSe_33100 [Microseira wollei NIES-4236]|uniref:Uncharacterized protein n=1 Tax=Microseira wollei NIES-4236 TaxID=2530354 RepID=A0AAV3X6P8_9CYAN|nr:hypothetical protein MiSe_33100 [Microseira wollei NIES-4236]